MLPLSIVSPDGQSNARLEFEGEIRFGPSFYKLSVNGRVMLNRVFGVPVLWSGDSRYVAVQEWLATEEATGPQTALVCIDAQTPRQCRVSTAKDGFIVPKSFEGEKLVYTKEHIDTHGTRVTEFEIEYLALPRWEAW